jgi:hypothetical protein
LNTWLEGTETCAPWGAAQFKFDWQI